MSDRNKYLDLTPEQIAARLTRVEDLAMMNVVEVPNTMLPAGTKVYQWTDHSGKPRYTVTLAHWNDKSYGSGMWDVSIADLDPRLKTFSSSFTQGPTEREAIVRWIEAVGWFIDEV